MRGVQHWRGRLRGAKPPPGIGPLRRAPVRPGHPGSPNAPRLGASTTCARPLPARAGLIGRSHTRRCNCPLARRPQSQNLAAAKKRVCHPPTRSRGNAEVRCAAVGLCHRVPAQPGVAVLPVAPGDEFTPARRPSDAVNPRRVIDRRPCRGPTRTSLSAMTCCGGDGPDGTVRRNAR